MPKLCDKKNVDMLTSHGIFTESEIYSRRDIMLDNYIKIVNIEACTMIDMSRKQILPAVSSYASDKASDIAAKKNVAPTLSCSYETSLVTELSQLTDTIDSTTSELETAVKELKSIVDIIQAAEFIRDSILPKMDALRTAADKAEVITSESYWPFPTYDKLLFGV